MVKVVERLPTKCEGLSSKPQYHQKKEKRDAGNIGENLRSRVKSGLQKWE
jgi:hypothetical protein